MIETADPIDQQEDLAIETTRLRRTFGDVVAVDEIDLKVHRGELVALLGPTGAGKTTAIRMMCCLLRPTGGTAVVSGHDTAIDPTGVKQVIAVSPQESAIAEHLDAWENLRLMARLHGLDADDAEVRAERLLDMFALTEWATDRVSAYSNGMKCRLCIAMALLSEPEVLFLDEPTLGLEPSARQELWDHIEALKGSITIVLTTHYLDEAEALADRVVVIDEGRVIAEGTVDELTSSVPDGRISIVEADLGEAGLAALEQRFGSVQPRDDGAAIERLDVTADEVVDVLRPLGIETRSLSRPRVTLSDVFVHLTGRELRD